MKYFRYTSSFDFFFSDCLAVVVFSLMRSISHGILLKDDFPPAFYLILFFIVCYTSEYGPYVIYDLNDNNRCKLLFFDEYDVTIHNCLVQYFIK